MLALTLTLLLCDSKVVYDTLAAHVADAVSDDDTVNRDDDKLRLQQAGAVPHVTASGGDESLPLRSPLINQLPEARPAAVVGRSHY